MIDWLDIPEIQLLAVIATGFFMGWLFVPKFLGRPVLFSLIAGIVFFTVRFLPAYAQLDGIKGGTIPGNGILAAGIMWVIYIFSMIVGYFSAKRRWPDIENNH